MKYSNTLTSDYASCFSLSRVILRYQHFLNLLPFPSVHLLRIPSSIKAQAPTRHKYKYIYKYKQISLLKGDSILSSHLLSSSQISRPYRLPYPPALLICLVLFRLIRSVRNNGNALRKIKRSNPHYTTATPTRKPVFFLHILCRLDSNLSIDRSTYFPTSLPTSLFPVYIMLLNNISLSQPHSQSRRDTGTKDILSNIRPLTQFNQTKPDQTDRTQGSQETGNRKGRESKIERDRDQRRDKKT